MDVQSQRTLIDLDDFFGLNDIFVLMKAKFHELKGEMESKNERILKLERSLEEKIAEIDFLKIKVGNLKRENSEHLKKMESIQSLMIGRKVTDSKTTFEAAKENPSREAIENDLNVDSDLELEPLMESTNINANEDDEINIELEKELDMESNPMSASKQNKKISDKFEDESLNLIEKIEMVESKFLCQKCNYKTNRNVQFKVHMLNHTDENISEIVRHDPIVASYGSFLKSGVEAVKVVSKNKSDVEPNYQDSEHDASLEALIESTNNHTSDDGLINVEIDREINSQAGIKMSEKEIVIRNDKVDKDYPCTECPYKTRRYVQLKVHKKTHTGEKIYLSVRKGRYSAIGSRLFTL